MTIKLKLEVEEVNTILKSLSKHPFDEIASLINNIKTQGDAQILEQEAAAKAIAEAQEQVKKEAAAEARQV